MNLKLCGIAAGAAFVLSLLVGTFSGGYFGISLLRALFFGVVFFILAGVIWMFINRFLPELLIPREEEPLMSGLEAGSRVNISVGDDDMSANAAIPLENNSRGDLGNVAEMVAKGSRAQSGGQNLAAPPPGSIPGRPGGGQTPGSPVLDLGAEAGYSRNGVPVAPGGGNQSGAPAASGPAAPAEDPGVVFVPSAPPSPLQSFSGGDIESLPDLDAMAGAFVSSGEEDGEESAASVPIFGAEPKPRGPGKARSREDDYNPKEVASAIQTILKRD